VRDRGDHLPRRRGRARRRERHDADAPVDEAPRSRLDRLRALPAAVGRRGHAVQARGCERPARLRVRAAARTQPGRGGAAAQARRGGDRRRPGRHRVRVSREASLRRRPQADRGPRRGRAALRGALARPRARDRQGSRGRGDRRCAVRPRRGARDARHRARAHGDGIGCGHLRRASVLGVPLLRRRRRAQRAADELLPLAAAARARRQTLQLRVRLRDHRRLPGREAGRGSDARGRDAAEPRRAGRRVHVRLRHGGRARSRKGRDGREAARALRVGRPRRARFGGDRDPGRGRPRDRDLRQVLVWTR